MTKRRRSDGDREEQPQSLEDFKRLCHNELDIVDVNGIKTPLILLDKDRYERIMDAYYPKSAERITHKAVSTHLDIWNDGLGHVFVDMEISFSSLKERIMIDAVENVDFFRHLSKSTMFALAASPKGSTDQPSHWSDRDDRVLVVQLPKPGLVDQALDLIKDGVGDGR